MAAPTPILNGNPQKADLPGGSKGNVAHQRHWIPDQRDALIGWLRGEFAAANAIIDALCQHLQLIGSPGEYDFVLGSIQQRRFSWNGILHMQQYYSVGEVLFSLQQILLRKQLHLHNTASPKCFVRGDRHHSTKDHRGKNIEAQRTRTTSSSESSSIRESEPSGHADSAANSPSTGLSPTRESNQHCNAVAAPVASRASSSNKEPDPLGEVVDEDVGGEQMNVAEGHLYIRAFSGGEATQLATKILETMTGDKTCIRGKLESPASVTPEVESEKEQEQEPQQLKSMHGLVNSLADRLKLNGIMEESPAPIDFAMHVIEKERSILLEDQPRYIISLLSESRIKPLENNAAGGSTIASSSLCLPAGSVLKLEESSRAKALAVTAAPSRRIILSLRTCSSVGEKSSTPQPPATQDDKARAPSAVPVTTKSAPAATGTSTKSAAASTCSSSSSSSSFNNRKVQLQAWPNQIRPGTGVYIPNSNSPKMDIPQMSLKA